VRARLEDDLHQVESALAIVEDSIGLEMFSRLYVATAKGSTSGLSAVVLHVPCHQPDVAVAHLIRPVSARFEEFVQGLVFELDS